MNARMTKTFVAIMTLSVACSSNKGSIISHPDLFYDAFGV